MLQIPPPPFRKRRGQAKRTPPTPLPPGPAALNLVSAAFDDVAQTLTLAFDRAIEVSGMDGAAIVIDDPVFSGLRFDATGGPELLGAETVRITLVAIGDPGGSSVRMTAGAGNGIVALDDPGAWAGVTDLELPWP